MGTCFNSILHFIHSRQCYGSCTRSMVIEASLSLFHSANILDVRHFLWNNDHIHTTTCACKEVTSNYVFVHFYAPST